MKQTLLPNGCSFSPLSVLPKNWKSTKKSVHGPWMIYYRYYDPTVKGPDGKVRPTLVRIKGMNKYADWDLRVAATESLIEEELKMLTACLFNPRTGQMNPPVPEQTLTDKSPLLYALEKAVDQMEVLPRVKEEARNYLTYVGVAMTILGFDCLSVSEVKSRHMAAVFSYLKEQTAHINRAVQEKYPERRKKARDHVSPAKYNRYRAYIQMIFKVLEKDLHLIETNPMSKVQKMKKVKKIRQILTREERTKIKQHLYTYHRDFYRFVMIFHQSGSRETELLAVRGGDVSLEKQVFKRIVRKRREGPTEVETIITDAALPYWKEALQDCSPEQYVFSKGLKPGDTILDSNQLNKRWRNSVKKDLGISCDLYSLKHLFTTEARAVLTAQELADHNAHTGTSMVEQTYDVEALIREQRKVRHIKITF